MKSKLGLALTATVLSGAVVMPSAQAMEGEWKGEISPYIWMAGLDTDVTVGGQTTNVDKSFSDVLDVTDFAGSVLGVLQKGHLVFWGQLDYLGLDSDNQDDHPANANLETDATFTTLAVGYQFDGSNGKHYDLMFGARMWTLDLALNVDGVGSFERDTDGTDAVVVFRPSLPISEKWRFNPTLSYGSGDSESTYELWPQFQYHMNDTWALRLGYRTLYYNVKDDNDNEFDGSFQGAMIGFGGTW
jgi:hypothetical protein